MNIIFSLSLKYLFSALQDCVAPLKRAAATAATEETAASLSDAFEADIRLVMFIITALGRYGSRMDNAGLVSTGHSA